MRSPSFGVPIADELIAIVWIQQRIWRDWAPPAPGRDGTSAAVACVMKRPWQLVGYWQATKDCLATASTRQAKLERETGLNGPSANQVVQIQYRLR